MKRIVFVFTVLLIFSVSLKSQTGWIVYSTGINAELKDIEFINANTGFITADTNCIFKSTNGGLNWFSVPLNLTSPAELLTISFLNQSTGFAGGGHHISEYTYTRYLFKTTDSGNNWLKIFHDSSYTMNGAISNIIPFNVNDIIVSNIAYIEVFYKGGIYKSTNGGINFSEKFSEYCNSLSFINQNTGYVVSKRTSDYQPSVTRILKTTDGCDTWTVQHRDSANVSSYFFKIQAFDYNTAYALNSTGTSTRFFKTSNGGDNWNFTPEENERYNDMFFVNPSTGWCGGFFGSDSCIISYTTNAGTNWILQKRGYNSSVHKIFFLNESTGWVILSTWGIPPPLNKKIMKTTTAGITFVKNVSTEIPSLYSLGQNYPNPFNPLTKIRFDIQKSESRSQNSVVTLKVFDALGREVETLVNEQLAPGTYEVTFNIESATEHRRTFGSGVYFYKLMTEGFSETKRMLLVK
ncbi:MAG: YCF48-related protein [Ignavibacteria bacterium]